jgi:cytochrome c-type biogenesis protein CcmH
MAMMPNMKLSNFQNVKLLARISKSGNAVSQPGDLIGVIDQVALADKGKHQIVINGQVK